MDGWADVNNHAIANEAYATTTIFCITQVWKMGILILCCIQAQKYLRCNFLEGENANLKCPMPLLLVGAVQYVHGVIPYLFICLFNFKGIFFVSEFSHAIQHLRVIINPNYQNVVKDLTIFQ